MMIEGSGSGFIPLTSGSGSGRPKTGGSGGSGSGFGTGSATLHQRPTFNTGLNNVSSKSRELIENKKNPNAI